MLSKSQAGAIDRRVYLLADHLDAILAAGEDLKQLSLDYAACRAPDSRANGALTLNTFVQRARVLEIAAMGRIKLARENASALARSQDQFALLARLFAAGTAVVVDAIDDVCDAEAHAFRDGFDPLAYMRARGLIGPDTGCLSVVEQVAIDDTFLLAGRIELGVLLDMCAQFLDTLDQQFDLFPELPGNDGGPSRAPAVADVR
jgi:hypothetical protein